MTPKSHTHTHTFLPVQQPFRVDEQAAVGQPVYKAGGALAAGTRQLRLPCYERQRRTIAIEYINASTARNYREIEERDPVARKRTQDDLRATAADPVRAREYLRKTSMIDALERAEAIA